MCQNARAASVATWGDVSQQIDETPVCPHKAAQMTTSWWGHSFYTARSAFSWLHLRATWAISPLEWFPGLLWQLCGRVEPSNWLCDGRQWRQINTWNGTHSWERMVGGSWLWSPARIHFGAYIRAIQQAASKDWKKSTIAIYNLLEHPQKGKISPVSTRQWWPHQSARFQDVSKDHLQRPQWG